MLPLHTSSRSNGHKKPVEGRLKAEISTQNSTNRKFIAQIRDLLRTQLICALLSLVHLSTSCKPSHFARNNVRTSTTDQLLHFDHDERSSVNNARAARNRVGALIASLKDRLHMCFRHLLSLLRSIIGLCASLLSNTQNCFFEKSGFSSLGSDKLSKITVHFRFWHHGGSHQSCTYRHHCERRG